MGHFDFAAVLLVLAAGLGYLNHRLTRLPPTIGLMALTLAASLAAVAAGLVFPAAERQAAAFVRPVDLGQALLGGMLAFLLFAGALHLDLADLERHKAAIAVLATLGVVVSTLLVGGLAWCLLAVLDMPMSPVHCLLFGALISPTDPIAVLALLRRVGTPRPLEVTMAGESVFNDGVGVAVFLALLAVAEGGHPLEAGHLAALLLRQAAGGAVLGLAAGYVVYRLLKAVDNYQLEVLLSLALAAGAYALAEALRLSGPLAVIVAGLLIGNPGRRLAMSPATVEHLDAFWELLDEILNAVLFVLLGLEVLSVSFSGRHLAAGLMAIPAVLLARLVSVGMAVGLLRLRRPVSRGTVRVLTWGGLRGALAVAMAMSLPRVMAERDAIVAMTYVVVVFSVLVQGLTIGPLARRWLAAEGRPGAEKSRAAG
jgi:CPA1 family monovalent cation:H+ antiporter